MDFGGSGFRVKTDKSLSIVLGLLCQVVCSGAVIKAVQGFMMGTTYLTQSTFKPQMCPLHQPSNPPSDPH